MEPQIIPIPSYLAHTSFIKMNKCIIDLNFLIEYDSVGKYKDNNDNKKLLCSQLVCYYFYKNPAGENHINIIEFKNYIESKINTCHERWNLPPLESSICLETINSASEEGLITEIVNSLSLKNLLVALEI